MISSSMEISILALVLWGDFKIKQGNHRNQHLRLTIINNDLFQELRMVEASNKYAYFRITIFNGSMYAESLCLALFVLYLL